METRVALIGIIVGNRQESTKLNEILHEYGQYVVGRMGVPYKDKDINVSASSSMRRKTSSALCRGN